ncbi:flagellin [Ruminococcaceae bacterium AM28-23LB]|nr:flagellin [Ruminococcaceae bacterium AM28-23LB]
MRIQHNIMAMNAYRNYSNNASSLSKNLEKLSSGYKINRAGDDAAGLAISEKMRSQITGLDKAQDNAKDGISLVKTAEGALTEVHDMLNRMYSLAEQSANGTYDGTDRTQLQKEVKALKNEIDRIADSSNFNGTELLNGDLATGTTFTVANNGSAGQNKSAINLTITADGTQTMGTVSFAVETKASKVGAAIASNGNVIITVLKGKDYTAADIQELLSKATVASKTKADVADAIKSASVSGTGIEVKGTGASLGATATTKATLPGKALKLQIGDTGDSFNQLAVSIKDCHVQALGLDKMSIADQDGAKAALEQIKSAINYVSDVRGTLGATQNRLEHTINNLSVMQENIQDAESTIRDTDVADEMMAYTKNNILVQSAQAMLAQANQVPQGVLQLLQ